MNGLSGFLDTIITRVSGKRHPIHEQQSYVEARPMRLEGVANLVYENEDLPLTDPIWGAVKYDREFIWAQPPGQAPFVYTLYSSPGITTGGAAMQPLANPNYTAMIASTAQSF